MGMSVRPEPVEGRTETAERTATPEIIQQILSVPLILRVALPVPLRRVFDYLPPLATDAATAQALQAGVRVRVPFGAQKLVGMLLEVTQHSDVPLSKLKHAKAVLDEQPPLPVVLFDLALWAASYYQHPVGEVLAAVLPTALREGAPQFLEYDHHWRLTAQASALAADALVKSLRGKQRIALYEWMKNQAGVTRAAILEAGFSRVVFKALLEQQMLESFIPAPHAFSTVDLLAETPLTLNEEQTHALAAIELGAFQACLLEGVTGSGKTEVYLQLIANVLARGEQALVLVPEIGLTPQTVARFRRRFRCPIAVLHSGLSDGERFAAWRAAKRGTVGIVIGTRSALFTPLARTGIIIVDEEHDSSFKQQDNFRYSARDLSVLRAQREAVPVLLGSATPSLETLHNALQGRYRHVQLTQRAGNARAPVVEVVSTHNQALTEGLTRDTLQAIRDELAAGNQALVFLNRRGFSPVLVCTDCRWQAACPHCSVRLTVHKKDRRLRCHHCDYSLSLPAHCPECRSTRLDCIGVGTQRSEQFFIEQFAEYPVLRMDRDSMARKQALQTMLDQVHRGKPCLLIGTQMLAKGHHFPHVTLVVILDIDVGLFSTDFRGAEKMAQLLEQVAGRAGRAEKPGRVLIQSQFAEHPLLQTLLREGYQKLARVLLTERRAALLPPFCYFALLRAEHKNPERALIALHQWREKLLELGGSWLKIAGPFPAQLEKRAGFYRFDLQIKSENRTVLQGVLRDFCLFLEGQKTVSGLRWTLDVDPV